MNSGLILNNVCKRFGDFHALRGVRATVPNGKITAFIGPNGAGKTTLFNVISGVLKPDSGSILFEGREILGLAPHNIAHMGIGRQFQDVRVFENMTVFENIMVASLPDSAQSIWTTWFGGKMERKNIEFAKDEAFRWLEFVGLLDKSQNMAKDLSFGQQKLVSLARLFAKGARFLLLDEPTAGLSHQMIERITSLIQRAVMEQNITAVLVEHNMDVVSDIAYWIHFMHEGKVAFSGEREHVLGNKNVREIYMGL